MDAFAQSDIDQLSDSDILRSRDQVLEQMSWIRLYTRQLVDSLPETLWFVCPEGMATHLAWQVGHLAVSQYGLMLFRQRGRQPGDLDIMPGWLRKQYGRGTTPAGSAEGQPSPGELLERLTTIHSQALSEVAQLPADVFREPTGMPFTAYPTKLGALMFCPLHESIHAGQIGLLRRQHGLDALR